MKFRKLILMTLCGVWMVSGCGYSTRSLLPSDLRTICILPVKNKISYSDGRAQNNYLPLLENKVQNAVTDRFIFDGHLKLATEDVADLVLKGELIGYNRTVLRTQENSDVQEYRIQIVVSLVLWDVVKEKPMWSEPQFVGEATYFVSGPQARSESDALQDALTDLARRVVERTIENW